MSLEDSDDDGGLCPDVTMRFDGRPLEARTQRIEAATADNYKWDMATDRGDFLTYPFVYPTSAYAGTPGIALCTDAATLTDTYAVLQAGSSNLVIMTLDP